jgi:hypothetical protein
MEGQITPAAPIATPVAKEPRSQTSSSTPSGATCWSIDELFSATHLWAEEPRPSPNEPFAPAAEHQTSTQDSKPHGFPLPMTNEKASSTTDKSISATPSLDKVEKSIDGKQATTASQKPSPSPAAKELRSQTSLPAAPPIPSNTSAAKHKSRNRGRNQRKGAKDPLAMPSSLDMTQAEIDSLFSKDNPTSYMSMTEYQLYMLKKDLPNHPMFKEEPLKKEALPLTSDVITVGKQHNGTNQPNRTVSGDRVLRRPDEMVREALPLTSNVITVGRQHNGTNQPNCTVSGDRVLRRPNGTVPSRRYRGPVPYYRGRWWI